MMERLSDINEVLNYLQEGDIATSDGKDRFVLKDGRVYRYSDGTHFSLMVKDFKELYKNVNFYLYEEIIEVDEQKDEAYYRYYRK